MSISEFPSSAITVSLYSSPGLLGSAFSPETTLPRKKDCNCFLDRSFDTVPKVKVINPTGDPYGPKLVPVLSCRIWLRFGYDLQSSPVYSGEEVTRKGPVSV